MLIEGFYCSFKKYSLDTLFTKEKQLKQHKKDRFRDVHEP